MAAHTEHRVLEPQEMLFLIVLDQHNRGPNKPDGTNGDVREGLDPILYATIQRRLAPFACNEVMLLEHGYCQRPAPDRTGRLVTRGFAITTEGRAAIPRFLRLSLEKAKAEIQACPHDKARALAEKLVNVLEGWVKVYRPAEIAPAPNETAEAEEEDNEETAEEGASTPVPRRSSTAPRRTTESVRAKHRPPTVAEARQKAATSSSKPARTKNVPQRAPR